MACQLIHIVTTIIACLSTLPSASAAPLVLNLEEPGLFTSGPDLPNPNFIPANGSQGPFGDIDSGVAPTQSGFSTLKTDSGTSTSPGSVLNKSREQNSSYGGNDMKSDGDSHKGKTFDFSANQGNSETAGKDAPMINNPWADIVPQQDASLGLDLDEDDILRAIFSPKGKCGDLCADFDDICSGNDECVIMENCTTICNKADGTQTALQPKHIQAPKETRCNKTGKVCVHGSCQDGQSCVCDLGYEGDTCADKTCFLPCQHGGTCYEVSEGRSTCACTPDWQGSLCQDKKCTLKCVRGSCQYKPPKDGGSMYCNCPFDWTGDLCDDKIPDPAASSKTLALAIGIGTPIVCLLALIIAWYILWRNRAVFVFKVINMFKAYEDDDEKLYDAYVSLTEGDYEFVRSALQPKLESMGHTLYLHARDGVAGDVKSEEILEAVEKSRRCIMLLSSNYINNEWCRFECLTAQHETCIKLKQRIIPILMDDIDKDKRKMDKTLRFIIDSVKCLRYPRAPLELTDAPTSTTYIHSESKGKKELAKFEKEQEKFWERLRLTMPKKRDSQKEKCPLSTGSSKLSHPHYSDKTGFKSLFSKLSENMPVGDRNEKSSSTEFSFMEPTSSNDKIGEGNPVVLISVAAKADSKLDSFYSDTLERSLTGDCSENSLVFCGEDMKRVVPADIHLKV